MDCLQLDVFFRNIQLNQGRHCCLGKTSILVEDKLLLQQVKSNLTVWSFFVDAKYVFLHSICEILYSAFNFTFYKQGLVGPQRLIVRTLVSFFLKIYFGKDAAPDADRFPYIWKLLKTMYFTLQTNIQQRHNSPYITNTYSKCVNT